MNRKDVRYHYYKACQLGINEVERLARKILREHHNLKEFVIGMGVYYFIDKNGNAIQPMTQRIDTSYKLLPEYISRCYYRDTYRYFQSINFFIAEWDSRLRLTTHRMRFTKDSMVKTDW